MPPPFVAALAERVLFVTVRVPLFASAPPMPKVALLPERVQFVTERVPALTPPPPHGMPRQVAGALPLRIVRAVRLAVTPPFTSNARTPPTAFTVSHCAMQPPSTITVCPVPSI